jgi:uncharacterized damage-inducible protein DinB
MEANMADGRYERLLGDVLDSWDRNNRILVNLLGAVPKGGLDLRAAEGSLSVGEMFTHMHNVRMAIVAEDAPEFARDLPKKKGMAESDRALVADMLNESARRVSEAVNGRLESGRAMEVRYDHPILMMQHLIWHEGYHHGQIKLALKIAGTPITNEEASPLTWGVWMHKKK